MSMGAIDDAGFRTTYSGYGIVTPPIDEQRLTASKALAYPAHISTRRPTPRRVKMAEGWRMKAGVALYHGRTQGTGEAKELQQTTISALEDGNQNENLAIGSALTLSTTGARKIQ